MLYLALLASIKFTNLLLAAFAVVIVCMQELLRGRWHSALVFAVCFLGGFLALWMACGQSLYNIPMYLHNSWHISQGYQQAMGLPTPGQLLWIGLTVIAVLLVYSLLYLIGHCGTSGTLSRVALLAAFLYLAWKHGFVRSDEHLYIFFVSALLPIVAFPALLDDVSHRRWPSQLLLALAGVMCIWGVHSTGRQFGSEILWYKPSRFTDQLRQHYNVLTQWTAFRASYERHLEKEKKRYNLPHTREVIGQASIDVLGHEQAIALYNGFTYRPRPVFQSYSAYTQHLARLNDDFYHSSQAPAYALLQLHAIDNRFPPLDDSLLLRSFIYRYDYVHTERGFQLWQRRSQPLQEDRDTPDFLRRETIKLNQPLELGELTHKRLWATLSLQPSLLGRLRSTLYKPPIVQLKIEDTQGRRSTFRLPLSQAATGFILNPLIEHSADYVCFMMGIARRQVHALTLEVPKKYVPYFHETARLELSELPFAHSGGACHELAVQAYFWMFQSYPITYETPYVPQNVRIDDRDAVMLHAPSTMEFAMPDGATSISGAFGFVEGAYTGHGKTEGATFRILWQKGQQHVELYRRRLEPSTVPGDRGLQDFRVHLQGVTGGSLVLQTDPGANNSWDWTVWTAIKID
jgi:hypothetical protein